MSVARGGQTLVTQAELFSLESQRGIGHLLVFMEQESMARLLGILTKEASGLLARAMVWRRSHRPNRQTAIVGGERSE